MIQHNQMPFLTERLQPDWLLENDRERQPLNQFNWISGPIIGLLFGLVFGLSGWLTDGLIPGLLLGLIYWITIGAIGWKMAA